ncbi:cytosolic carboxypeptidase 4 [Bombina bombina]|uniref:cytosolic carboxypeptidase 4 n=1 Tax=Bombina bombina TaxID=8345 RepID=UPI00235B29DF|nr:cytosolic carboxypeptidase 4 [Bombina bombina]
MATEGASGLQVLLSTLQDSCEKDVTLNILSVLSELLSAGTHKRIHYMISKGGSEALLQTLVNLASSASLDYTLLLPLLRLLVKVGQRDLKFGEKAQKKEATDITLTLARKNLTKFENLTPCLWALQVFASNVPTGAVLGINGAMELIFKVITPYTTRHTQTIKAAIEALAALLKSKSNCRRAVNRGYVHGLLQLYKEWHLCDSTNSFISIRRGLLRCLKHITNVQSGRDAFLQARGMEILFTTAQECLPCKSLDFLVSAAVQVMRKCFPKCPLSLDSIHSSYTFPIPKTTISETPTKTCSSEVDSEDEEEDADKELGTSDQDNKDEDEDLETDLNILKSKPKPDRDEKEFEQYKAFCSELFHNFQDLEFDTEEDPNATSSLHDNSHIIPLTDEPFEKMDGYTVAEAFPPLANTEIYKLNKTPNGTCLPEADYKSKTEKTNIERNCIRNVATSCSSSAIRTELTSISCQCIKSSKERPSNVGESEKLNIVNELLSKHSGNIPFHDPKMYMAMAGKTKSVPDYKVLAFPDFWGHSSPPYSQILLDKKFGSQRSKVFEDIKRYLKPGELLNRVVFDLDNPSVSESCEEIECLKFYSRFESGNLHKVIHVREYEYDLIMNADVNTDEHHQWFYFEVSAMKANVPYRFNVINCEKVNSQFNYGMQPVMYSVKEALNGKMHWLRTGYDISYYKNEFCYRASDGKKRRFYTLTFTIKFPHNEDVCYLAYHYPYTYSTLMSHLQLLEEKHNSKKIYYKQQTLCQTLGGNPCPVITITAMPQSKNKNHIDDIRNRHYLVLTARVHPGESNSSWVMKGTLEFLTSSDPVAEILREMFVFKIIPMLNPDGVINGNHRCSLNGEDLNRQWVSPKPNLQPTIYHIKGLLYYLYSINKAPLVFCDYHGHSQKKNVFVYGCSIKETLWQAGCVVDSATLLEDVGYRALPKILNKIAPAFSMANCSFVVEKARESTARVVVWREIGVLRSYTMESTYCGFNQGSYKGLQVGTKELEEMGAKFCLGLLILQTKCHYNKAMLPQVEALLEAERENTEHQRTSTTEIDDEPPCAEQIDYNSDSCSDQEVESSDLDSTKKLRFSEYGDYTEEDTPTSSELHGEECFASRKSKDCLRTSISFPTKQDSCSPETKGSHCEQNCDFSANSQMGHCLY